MDHSNTCSRSGHVAYAALLSVALGGCASVPAAELVPSSVAPAAAPLLAVDLTDLVLADVRAAQTARGPGYAFLFQRRADAAPEWGVRGGGVWSVADHRVMLSEHAELLHARGDHARWHLELEPSGGARLKGELWSEGARYRVDAEPRGRLLLGEGYGVSAVHFLEGEEVVATIDLSGPRAAIFARAGLPRDREGLLTAAAMALVLRRHALDRVGTLVEDRTSRGLGDFTCLTFTCDERITAQGVEIMGQEQVSNTVHRGRVH